MRVNTYNVKTQTTSVSSQGSAMVQHVLGVYKAMDLISSTHKNTKMESVCVCVYTHFPSETVSFRLCLLPTCCVVEDDLDLLTLLPSSPQFCSSRHTALCPLYTLLGSDQGFVQAEQVLS